MRDNYQTPIINSIWHDSDNFVFTEIVNLPGRYSSQIGCPGHVTMSKADETVHLPVTVNNSY